MSLRRNHGEIQSAVSWQRRKRRGVDALLGINSVYTTGKLKRNYKSITTFQGHQHVVQTKENKGQTKWMQQEADLQLRLEPFAAVHDADGCLQLNQSWKRNLVLAAIGHFNRRITFSCAGHGVYDLGKMQRTEHCVY